jgi:polar amino acid transport system ATP-binding protein
MIEIDNVHKSFGNLEVVKGVNLTVNKGEVVSIIGGSGSGKSTLLMCINGLEPIQKGNIRVDGVEVHHSATDLNRLRQKIGIVFQQWNAFPHLTVLENVMLAPRKVLGKSKAEAEELAVKQLTHVGLGDKLKTFPASCPAASSNAWPSPVPWRCRRTTCCSTKPPRPSTRNWWARCWTPCACSPKTA